MQTERKLVSKLAEVMKQVGRIPKRGENKFHNYKYATEADVSDHVRDALAERKIILIPNVKSYTFRDHVTSGGKKEYIVTVEVEFTFYDGETGEAITFTMVGEGQDAGDKAAYKAMTGAEKYALMKSLMIPTGDDPEADDGVDQRNHGENRRNERKATERKPPEFKPNNQPQTPPTLREKYQQGKGSLEGFDEWVKGQLAKGRTFAQMEQLLDEQLGKKAGGAIA